jgi:hypothetical protein
MTNLKTEALKEVPRTILCLVDDISALSDPKKSFDYKLDEDSIYFLIVLSSTDLIVLKLRLHEPHSFIILFYSTDVIVMTLDLKQLWKGKMPLDKDGFDDRKFIVDLVKYRNNIK